MPARIIDINDPNIHIPEFIVLDASIILWLRPNPQALNKNFSIALNFFNRLKPLAEQGHVMPLLPLLAFEECFFKICQTEIKAHLNNKGLNVSWHDFYKQQPNILLQFQSNVNDFQQILQAFPIVVTEPEDLAILPVDTESRIAERMIDFIFQFSILPKDATILSEAERLGVDTVVTLDNDWVRADGFSVITSV